ncbi:hypothetical protein H1Q59_04170 [Holosporaceae bacterium 'Namur']|nr:hypothetical protein [Holosporaceae bacterium 'Namur']
MSTIAPSPPVQSPTVSPVQNQSEVRDSIKIIKISLLEELFKLTGMGFTVDEALNSPDIPINFFKEKLKAAEKFEEEAAAHEQLKEKYELFKEKHFMEKGWYKRIEKDYVKCKNEFDDLVDRFYACKYDSDCE